jgi:hypothetical protein
MSTPDITSAHNTTHRRPQPSKIANSSAGPHVLRQAPTGPTIPLLAHHNTVGCATP